MCVCLILPGYNGRGYLDTGFVEFIVSYIAIQLPVRQVRTYFDIGYSILYNPSSF